MSIAREAWFFGIALATVTLVGCSSPAPDCAGIQGYGLVIEVTNANSGEALCDATVRLTHDTYEDTLTSDGLSPCAYLGGTKSGTYSIDVTHDGYGPQSMNVDVPQSNNCAGLDTQDVGFPLTPLP